MGSLNYLDIFYLLFVKSGYVFRYKRCLSFFNVVYADYNVRAEILGRGERVNIFDVDACVCENVDNVAECAYPILELCGDYRGCINHAVLAEYLFGFVRIGGDQAQHAEIVGIGNAERADVDSLVRDNL